MLRRCVPPTAAGARISGIADSQPFWAARISLIRAFVAQENREHFHSTGCVNRLENDSVPAQHLAIMAPVNLILERFHKAAEGVGGEFLDMLRVLIRVRRP